MLKTMEEQIAHPGVDIIDTFSSPYFMCEMCERIQTACF